jgi:nucleoside-diphosphate-sugar epimerase
MAGPTAFVTGGTGFFGSHVVRALLSRGWTVRALLRRAERPGGLQGEPVEFVPGSLAEAERYRQALEGCDAVFHLAGLVKARSLAEYREANVRGTETLAAAVRDTAPSAHFVYCSSQSAAGPSRGGRVREADPARPVSWYGRSKLEAEEAVARILSGSRWTILRPGVLYGPRDRGLLVYFRMAARGWVPVLAGGRGRVQLLWAPDAAASFVAIAGQERFVRRRCFVADPEPVTYGEIADEMAALRDPSARKLPLPAIAIRAAGWGASVLEALTGRSRPFNRDKVREILEREWVCDPAPFWRDLKNPPLLRRGEGFRRTSKWYREQGWI